MFYTEMRALPAPWRISGRRRRRPGRQQEVQENKTPMIRLVNSIIERAVSVNASDIHFEPTEDNMVIRMRIDGQLQQVSYMEGKLKN